MLRCREESLAVTLRMSVQTKAEHGDLAVWSELKAMKYSWSSSTSQGVSHNVNYSFNLVRVCTGDERRKREEVLLSVQESIGKSADVRLSIMEKERNKKRIEEEEKSPFA